MDGTWSPGETPWVPGPRRACSWHRREAPLEQKLEAASPSGGVEPVLPWLEHTRSLPFTCGQLQPSPFALPSGAGQEGPAPVRSGHRSASGLGVVV